MVCVLVIIIIEMHKCVKGGRVHVGLSLPTSVSPSHLHSLNSEDGDSRALQKVGILHHYTVS